MDNEAFKSELIDSIREAGGEYSLKDGRCVLLPKTFGFCSGVRRAVSKLSEVICLYRGRRIWLLGAMIHNSAVNAWFIGQGVNMVDSHCLDGIFETASPGDVFVIPAFGLPLDVEQKLRCFVDEKSVIIDATCPFVRRVWDAAGCAGEKGNAVIIHGKYGHQETEAIWSRAVKAAPACVLLPSPVYAERYVSAPESIPVEYTYHAEKMGHVAWTLVNQTTMLATETAHVAEILARATWHSGAMEMAGTLCTATRERQAAALDLCSIGCDVILVLGGVDSSNTAQLYRLAVNALGADRCFFIEKAGDILPMVLRHYLPDDKSWHESHGDVLRSAKRIGILTGASCPDSELEKLILRLSEQQD